MCDRLENFEERLHVFPSHRTVYVFQIDELRDRIG